MSAHENSDKKETKCVSSATDTLRRTILQSHGYELLNDFLGKGSYAVVQAATSQRHHGRTIAIKIISKRRAPQDYLQRFLPRELEVIKHLRHVNVVCFLQCIETTNRVYIMMDLASNGDLLDYIKKVKRVDEERSCRWFHHLVNGITYCHSKGIVHRDLKCENLLLDYSYVLKITDFGFARGELDIDVNGPVVNRGNIFSKTFCGSYAYAPPEILKGQPYEMHMADVWSMGVVLFTMLCGRLPFNDSDHKVLLKEVQRPIKFPNSSTLSEEGRILIRKILSPVKDRLYLPQIRKETWYIENFNPNWPADAPPKEDHPKPSDSDESDKVKAKRLTAKTSVERLSTDKVNKKS